MGLGIYIPVDAVLPDALIDSLGIRKNYHKRLRTIKLRGLVSQGLLISAGQGNVEGQDVTEVLGITKYDPPIPNSAASRAVWPTTSMNWQPASAKPEPARPASSGASNMLISA